MTATPPARAVRRLLATSLAIVLAGLGLVATAVPAAACSCAGLPVPELVGGADAVFVGVLDDVDRGGGTATYTFTVTGVLRGEVGGTAEVHSAADGASCGLELMETGRSYVVMAAEGRAGLCGGTAPARPSYVAQVEEVTGEARTPAGTGPESLEPGRDDGDRPGSATALAVVGAGLLAVVAVALVPTRRGVLTRRVGGPRRSRPSGSPPRS